MKTGTPGRTRTLNTRFWRPMLYQLNYWRVNDKRLASLFVHRVTTAPGAILLNLHTIRHGCLVLGRRVVATLALSACKGDESTHESITSKYRPQRARWKRLASYLRRCQCDVPCRGLSADTFHIFRRYVRLSPHVLSSTYLQTARDTAPQKRTQPRDGAGSLEVGETEITQE